jgi:hypothetical protein
MLFKSIDERDRKLFVDVDIFRDQDEPEVLVDPTFDAMRAQAKVHVPHTGHCDVVLKSKLEKLFTKTATIIHFMLLEKYKTVEDS